MKYLFDSSVIIAALIQSHPKHESALRWLSKVVSKEFSLFISARSLLEIYSVLTSAPFEPKITPETAKRLIDENLKNNAEIVHLTHKQYFEIVADMTKRGLTGGIVYDALIMKCAVKSDVDYLLTLNSKDFVRLQDAKKKVEVIGI